MHPLLESLNPSQREAVRHPGGPSLILAGAGSGKTRVLTHRVAWLIEEQSVDPWRITAVTFTNKAAAEMRERVEALLGGPRAREVALGTFHHYCVRLLRREAERLGIDPNFVIYDTPEQLAIVKKVLRHRQINESTYSPRRLLSRISSAKNRLHDPEEVRAAGRGPWARVTADVYGDYQATLDKANAFDFDDLLVRTVRLLEEDAEAREKYQERTLHLLVDEYQDTNHAQYRLIKALTGRHRNLTVVGDEDQSIFSWRGADISNILDFERDFPEARIYRLEQNYRSTSKILAAALGVVSQNEQRKGKELWTENEEGEPVLLYRAAEGRDEATWVTARIGTALKAGESLADMAIMYRTHAQSRPFEEELLRAGIPYIVLGGVRFYQRREVKDLLAYLALAVNPGDPAAFTRVLNVPSRGIGAKTRAAVEEHAARRGLTLWEALEELIRGEGDLGGRAITALKGFRDLITTLSEEAETRDLDEMVEAILRLTQYLSVYDNEAEEERLARKENVEQLITATGEALQRGESIQEFLAGVALQSDVDALQGTEALPLMSLHSAKGLEFRQVFLVGLEEGLLPHANSVDDPDSLEEERRLCYVGMTRARRRLFLTTAATRRLRGRLHEQVPSRFLDEIPGELLEEESSPLLATGFAGGASSAWSGPSRPSPRRSRSSEGGGAGAKNAPSREEALKALESWFGEKGKRVAEKAARRQAATRAEGSSKGGPSGKETAASSKGSKPTPRFRKGDKVRHTRYGGGVVLSVEPVRGDQKLTVKFSAHGVKKFYASHAPIDYLLGGR